MKRVLYGFLAVIVLILAGGILMVSRVDTEMVRTQLAEWTLKATGQPLYMAEAPKVTFWPLGVSFGAVQWGARGDATEPGLSVAVKSGSVQLEALPLLRGRIVVREVRLDSPDVRLRLAPSTSPAPASEKKPSAAPTLPLELARLSIVNGSLAVDTEKGPLARVDGFNASIVNLLPGAETVVNLDLGLHLHEPLLSANMALAAKMRLQGARLDIRQTSLTVTPLEGLLPAGIGPVQLTLDGNYALDRHLLECEPLKLALQGGKADFSGTVDLESVAAQGTLRLDAQPGVLAGGWGMKPPLGGKDALTLDTRLTLEGVSLRLSELKGTLGSTLLRGELSLKGGTAPSVRGSLEAEDIPLDELLARPQAATLSSPADAKSVRNAEASSQTQILPALDLNLKAASLTYAALRFTHLQARVRGQEGDYAVEPLTFKLNTGGEAVLRLRAELRGQRYFVSGQAADVAVGPLMQAMKGTRPLDATAFLELELQCAGRNMGAWENSLSGKGNLTLRHIALNGISLVPRNAPLRGDIPTRFESLQAPFTVKNGVISVVPLALNSPSLKARGRATISLPQRTLDAAADVQTLGVTLPIVASGPFQSISYGLDPRRTLESLGNLPGGALNLGKAAGGTAKDGAQHLGKAVKGLLGF